MLDYKNLIGVASSAAGTALAVQFDLNEILQTVSLILTILGALWSLLILPLITKYRKAKEDGKVTADEVVEMIDTAADGIKKVNEEIKDIKKEDK